jgi:cytochrome c553
MNKLFIIAVSGLWMVLTFCAQASELMGDPRAAKGKVSMCIGCHGVQGYRASFPEIYRVPMLGGQNAKYIELALKAYRKGDRKHPTMRSIAISLSDQDIADLAAYYSQQTTQTSDNYLK